MSDFDDYLAATPATAKSQSFDDYLNASPTQAAPAAAQQPEAGMLPQSVQDIRNWVSAHGLGGPIGDFYGAAAHNIAKPLHGTAQLIEHGLGGAANLVAPNSGVAQFFNQDNAQNDAALRQWEQAYQAGTPDNAASLLGAAGGSVILLAMGAGQKLGEGADYLANLIPKAPQFLKNIVSGGIQGGTLGLTQPVTSQPGDQSFASQKLGQAEMGALTGGGINTLTGLGGAVGRGLSPLINPQGTVRQYLGSLLGDQAPQVLQNLRNAPTFVPGSVPTSAQVAGSPELVMAEKALGNQFPAFKAAQMSHGNANNAARLDALQQIAGTPQDLTAALAARKAVAAPQIDQLLTNGNPVPVQPVLDALSGLQNSSLGVRPTIKGAISDLRQEITSRAQNGTIAPDILDGLRQNIGDYLRKNAPNGAPGTQAGVAFEPIKNQITAAIDGANPGYSNYLANYARMSQPITDARAASGILDNLGNGSLNSAKQVQLNPRSFNAQLKRATSGPYPLSPNAQNTLEGIQNDLQRDTVSNSVRSPGSDTAYNLSANNWLASKLYGDQFGGNGALPKLIGGAVGSFIPGIGTLGGYLGMGKFAENVQNRLGGAISDVMMDPTKMAAALQKLQQNNPAAATALQRYLTQQSALQAGQQAGQ